MEVERKVTPNSTPDLSQLNPDFTPDLSQLNPDFTPDLSQFHPDFIPDFTKKAPKNIVQFAAQGTSLAAYVAADSKAASKPNEKDRLTKLFDGVDAADICQGTFPSDLHM